MKLLLKSIFILSLVALASSLQAQSLRQAITSVDADLESALQELAQLREEIAAERIPLATEVEELEREVLSLNADLNREQRLRDNRDIGLQALEDEVESKQEEIEYIRGLLRDFVNTFNAQLTVSERQIYIDMIRDVDSAANDPEMSQKELFDMQMEIVNESADRMGSLIGGYTFDGVAVSTGGEIIDGKFAQLGPVTFFRSDDLNTVGITRAQTGNATEVINAQIAVADSFVPETIAAFIDGNSGSLPLDGTLGSALILEQNKDDFFSHIEKGGLVGYLILGLASIALLIAIYKIISIYSFRVPSGTFVLNLAEMVKAGQKDEALKKAKSFGGLAGEMFEEAVENSDQPRGLIEEYLSVKIIVARRKLESMLPFIAITAAAAPLMGLLGTVVGMIKTFQLITVFGTGDARQLSDGISEALVTTELGLFVAIPSLIIHGILNRMARTKWGQLEQDSIVFLNDIKED